MLIVETRYHLDVAVLKLGNSSRHDATQICSEPAGMHETNQAFPVMSKRPVGGFSREKDETTGQDMPAGGRAVSATQQPNLKLRRRVTHGTPPLRRYHSTIATAASPGPIADAQRSCTD